MIHWGPEATIVADNSRYDDWSEEYDQWCDGFNGSKRQKTKGSC